MSTDLGKSALSYLSQKTVLLQQYLSVTSEFMDALKEKRFEMSESFILKRQRLIQKIEALDRSFEGGMGTSSQRPTDRSWVSREVIRENLDSMRKILAEVESQDRSLKGLAKEEGDSLRGELLRLRTVRNAALGYGRAGGSEPRFLDMRE